MPKVQRTLTGEPLLETTNGKSKGKGKGKSKVERAYTDVILTIKPEFVELLAAKTKNHEYRGYKLRPTACRMWLYETAPISAITHVLSIGAPREPGQVKDSSGIGNDDFDAGKKVSKYGYPVHGMRRLVQPLDSTAMKEKYGIAPPQGYLYAPEVLVKDVPLDGMEVLY